MYMKTSTLLASALALCATAAPLPAGTNCTLDAAPGVVPSAAPGVAPDVTPSAAPDATPDAASTGGVTAEQIIAIAPTSASCAGANFPEECADAATAATAINSAFATYKITSKGEKAALIAYMAFESGDFKFKKNHFPGRPGQGTRMMAMPPFVSKYATAVAGAEAVASASAAGGDAGLNAVLDLVNSDDAKSFGSAAWFMTATCTPEVRAGLVAETTEGWHAFLTECVGTTAAPERDAPWTAAKQAILA